MNMRIRELQGLGKKSEEILKRAGISSVEEFMASDPFELYLTLRQSVPGVGLNFLYAMLGAQEHMHWQQIARERKTAILMRLDEMGIAP